MLVNGYDDFYVFYCLFIIKVVWFKCFLKICFFLEIFVYIKISYNFYLNVVFFMFFKVIIGINIKKVEVN